MRTKTNHWLPKVLGVGAITLYPYVFFAEKKPSHSTFTHEYVHCEQVEIYGWFQFYLSYLVYYIAGRIQGLGHDSAYVGIPYEEDAYTLESRAYYLEKTEELWKALV